MLGSWGPPGGNVGPLTLKLLSKNPFGQSLVRDKSVFLGTERRLSVTECLHWSTTLTITMLKQDLLNHAH